MGLNVGSQPNKAAIQNKFKTLDAKSRIRRNLDYQSDDVSVQDLEDLTLLTNALQRLNDLNQAEQSERLLENLYNPEEPTESYGPQFEDTDEAAGPEETADEDYPRDSIAEVDGSQDYLDRERRARLLASMNYRNFYRPSRYGRYYRGRRSQPLVPVMVYNVADGSAFPVFEEPTNNDKYEAVEVDPELQARIRMMESSLGRPLQE